ncbi:MAG: response regulator [Acidobacteria bacterium]|nr:response regulator [Acidobacteriota bacterium]
MKRITLIQILFFFLVVMLLGGAWHLQHRSKADYSRHEFQILSRQFSIRLREFMKTRITIIERLAKSVHASRLSPENFATYALPVFTSFPGFEAINHISDTGVIDAVVPLERNRPALHFDLMKSTDTKKLFQEVMRSGLTLVSGPIELFSMEPGFIVLVPVQGDHGPVAAIAGVFDAQKIMGVCFTRRELAAYRFRITDGETDGRLFPAVDMPDDRMANRHFEVVSLAVGSRAWEMKVFQTDEPGDSLFLMFLVWFVIILSAGSFSYFVGRFLHNNYELKVNEARFRILLDAIPDAFILLEPGGHVLDYQAPRGWSCCESVPDGASELSDLFVSAVTTDSLEQITSYVQSCFLSQEVQTFETQLSWPDKEINVEMRIVPYGEDLALLMIRNISRQRQAEKRLKASRERYQTVFEASQDPIFITTVRGRFVEMNKAGLDFFGAKTLGQLKSVLAEEVYADKIERAKLLKDLRENGFVRNRHLAFSQLDGTKREALVSVRLLESESGDDGILVGTLHDITELNALQEQLLQAQKMESIGRLAGGVAHDFNNILSGVMGYASLMKTKMSPTHPFYDYVETIERGAVRASELTARLLGFAKQGQFTKIRLDVNKIAADTAKLLQSTIKKTIEVNLKLEDNVPPVVGDPSQIHQVVMNLCVNARDAMPDGGRLTLASGSRYVGNPPGTTDKPLQEGTYTFIQVQDTGIGMSPETRQKIFEPFFTTKADKGTGLGLAMVYGVVQNHGGFIDAQSDPGVGSVFTIYLPVATEVDTKKEATVEINNTFKAETGLILFVDDEADNRSLAKEILDIHGIEVIAAADGLEALELYRKHRDRIDGVVLDMIMPKMDGNEVFLELKEMNDKVNVMLISGYSNDGEIKKLTEENNLLFLRKPFKIDEMVQKIQELISRGKR